MTTADFIQHGCRDNAWVCMPGWHIDVLMYDWLHVLDLALVPDCVASALLELTAPGVGLFAGSDQDERLRNAYVQFNALCKQHKVRFLTCKLVCLSTLALLLSLRSRLTVCAVL